MIFFICLLVEIWLRIGIDENGFRSIWRWDDSVWVFRRWCNYVEKQSMKNEFWCDVEKLVVIESGVGKRRIEDRSPNQSAFFPIDSCHYHSLWCVALISFLLCLHLLRHDTYLHLFSCSLVFQVDRSIELNESDARLLTSFVRHERTWR